MTETPGQEPLADSDIQSTGGQTGGMTEPTMSDPTGTGTGDEGALTGGQDADGTDGDSTDSTDGDSTDGTDGGDADGTDGTDGVSESL